MFNESSFDYYRASKVEWGYPPGTKMIDFVEDDMKHLIHPHWTTFPAANPIYRYFFASVFGFIFFFGSLGNLLVIKLFTKRKTLKSPQHNYLVNLAISDMGMLMSQYPAYSYNTFYGASWQFGPEACTLYATSGNLFAIASMVTISAMLYERYKVIVRGVSPDNFTNGKSYLSIALIWAYSIFWVTGPFAGFGKNIPEATLETCSYDFLTNDKETVNYVWAMLFTNFGVPMLISTHCMMQITFAGIKHNRQMREQAAKMNMSSLRCTAEHFPMKEEIHYAKVLIAEFLIFVWMWAPYLTVRIQAINGDRASVTPLQLLILSLYAKSACVVSPIILAIGYKKYRAQLKRDLPFFCTWFIDPFDTDPSVRAATTHHESA